MLKLNVSLNVAGDAEVAFESDRSVLGGECSSAVRLRDVPIEGVTIPSGDQGKIMHIGLPIGSDSLMATDTLALRSQELIQAITSASRSAPIAGTKRAHLQRALCRRNRRDADGGSSPG